MKNLFTILSICLLLITTCTGCQLALPEEATAGDELIGVYVTTENLQKTGNIDIDFLGNVSMEQPNQGKIYGTFDEKTETLTFPDITGYPLFLITEYDEDGVPYHRIVTDASERNTSVNVTDTGSDSTEISGTFYYDVEYVYSTPGEHVTLYCNSLYKTPAGELYIIPETGVHLQGNCGISQSSEAKTTNGKKTNGESFKVTAQFKEMISTDTVTFTQIDENGQAIQEDSYRADTIPESYAFSPECEYIFVTNTDMKGNKRYDIINKDEETYSIYFSTDHIFCKEVQIEITH